ncbi:MAG: hypothetical protein L0H93_09610 [Nocardioides sp.]|nr:hypothetical protein [Nocardioides sp.]
MTSCHSDDDQRASEWGERVAAWLEELDLAAHLAEAGLPSYTRDAQGRAVWTDPNTGDPLTSDQLRQLDGVLHNEGDDPAYAVPVPLVQIAQRARVRKKLLASPVHDYQSLAELRGASVNATRFAVHKAAEANELLVLTTDERIMLPAFQLTSSGEPRTEIVAVLKPLLAAGMDPWNAWAWLAQPAALLGGQVPERAAADPEEADLVRHAAVRLAERVAADS